MNHAAEHVAAWRAFCAECDVGGAIPVTFDVTYVGPRDAHLRKYYALGETLLRATGVVPAIAAAGATNVSRGGIPCASTDLADGEPLAISRHARLPTADPNVGALRYLALRVYEHELDEQFRRLGERPLDPHA